MLTLTQLCAKHDQGGGVGFQNVFAIYSVALPPSIWHTHLRTATTHPTSASSRLAAAASAAAATIPIYCSLDQIPPDKRSKLTSLPHSFISTGESRSQIRQQKPWFLINAARAGHHCIIGRSSGDLTESLLVILRRPWCVLELCCCDIPTVSSMLAFAVQAREYDSKLYRASVHLLSHEMAKRAEQASSSSLSTRAVTTRNGEMRLASLPLREPRERRLSDWNLSGAWELFTVLSPQSMQSYNSFWLRLVCMCAMPLGVTFSDLARALHDDRSVSTDEGRQQQQQLVLTSRRRVGALLAEGISRPSMSPRRENSLRRSTSEGSLWAQRRGSGNQAWKRDFGSPVEIDCGSYLIVLYTQILHTLGEWQV